MATWGSSARQTPATDQRSTNTGTMKWATWTWTWTLAYMDAGIADEPDIPQSHAKLYADSHS